MSGREKTETGGSRKTAAEKAEEMTSAFSKDQQQLLQPHPFPQPQPLLPKNPPFPQPPQQHRIRISHSQLLSLPQPLPHPPQPLPPQPPQQQRRRMIHRQELFSPHPFPHPPHPQLFVHPLSQPHPQFVAVNSLIVKSSERFLIYNVIVCG